MCNEVKVLGIDLGSVRWNDNGSALLIFDRREPSHWIEANYSVIQWPEDQPLTAQAMATTIDTFVREKSIAAVSFDGPQGWREPNVERCQRLCERAARTQGKTGPYGITHPRTQFRWFSFCIEVFKLLTALEWTHLANDPNQILLNPLPKGSYWLLECYPTSTWRHSHLPVLPGKKNPVCTLEVISNFAQALWQRYVLPPFHDWNGSHDDLQAVVAALPAAALLGGPCQSHANGQSGRTLQALGAAPEHWVEGVIWDAGLAEGRAVEPIEIVGLNAAIANDNNQVNPDNPLVIEDLDHDAGDEAIDRGVRLFQHLVDSVRLGAPVGIGYKGFACFVHGVGYGHYGQIVGRGWSQADTPYVLELARQVTLAAGGPQVVLLANVNVFVGMDAFIWQQTPPHNRNAAAFPNAAAVADWLIVFPDGLRRLITVAELGQLLQPQ